MKIGVLALRGACAGHCAMLGARGAALGGPGGVAKAA